MKKLLTTKDVAEYFGVSEYTVTQKFIKEGLKFFRVGKKDFRYNENDLIEFEELKKEHYESNEKIILNTKCIYSKFPTSIKVSSNEMKVY